MKVRKCFVFGFRIQLAFVGDHASTKTAETCSKSTKSGLATTTEAYERDMLANEAKRRNAEKQAFSFNAIQFA